MVFTKQKNGQIHITVADKEKHHELLKEHEKEHSVHPQEHKHEADKHSAEAR